MILFPNVKINLGLHVTGKRNDGYHNLESVFYPVPWKEVLEVVPTSPRPDAPQSIAAQPTREHVNSKHVNLITHGQEIPGSPTDNIIYKVASALSKHRELPSLDIHLIKRLPMGAGLGGGSADAAFALRGINQFLKEPLSDREAEMILASVGSDCPFFWRNRPMYVTGRGDVMEEIELDLSGMYACLVNPGIHISTKEAYASVTIDPRPGLDLRELPNLPIEEWKGNVYNAFEAGIFQKHHGIGRLKTELYDLGAVYASMTGSGSTVYGIFKSEPSVPESWKSYQNWIGKL